MEWPLQDAKNQFSRVVREAREKGPQVVTLRGAPAVVVLSAEDYAILRATRPSLVEDLLAGPAWDDGLAASIDWREKVPSRDPAF